MNFTQLVIQLLKIHCSSSLHSSEDIVHMCSTDCSQLQKLRIAGTFLACCIRTADIPGLAVSSVGSGVTSGSCIALKGCFGPGKCMLPCCREHAFPCQSSKMLRTPYVHCKASIKCDDTYLLLEMCLHSLCIRKTLKAGTNFEIASLGKRFAAAEVRMVTRN